MHQINNRPEAVISRQALSNLKGHALDAAYVGETVQDHRRAIADFRSDAKNSQDPQLKAFAAKYLPVLEDHLQLADAPERE